MIEISLTMALIFAIVTVGLLWLDLHAHKKDQPISITNAAIWSSVYIVAALFFAFGIYLQYGYEYSSLFLTGYVLEKVLAVDNLIVFSAIFAYWKIPDKFQHRILYWGIIGAAAFRLIFVAIGAGSLILFGPVVELLFASIILYTAVILWRDGDDDEEKNYSDMLPVKFVSKVFPVKKKIDSHNFFIVEKVKTNIVPMFSNRFSFFTERRKIYITPLFLCLITIEISDILFAFDSVPAVIAVTREPFLIYSAMIFAILGLRSLYFVLSALKRYLVHLEKAVIAVLIFIAVKLGLHSMSVLLGFDEPFHIESTISLIIVFSILLMGAVASFVYPKQEIEQ